MHIGVILSSMLSLGLSWGNCLGGYHRPVSPGEHCVLGTKRYLRV